MSNKKTVAYNKSSDDLVKLKNRDNISDDINYMFDSNNNLIKDDKPYIIIILIYFNNNIGFTNSY